MAIVKFVYKDEEYECDDAILHSYTMLKRIAQAKQNKANVFEVFSAMFAGKDEEYAARLNDSMEEMGELCAEAMRVLAEKK